MARIEEPTKEQEAAWQQWVAERPDGLREIAERFDPWSLYRMKSTGHRVTVHGFSEGNPVTLIVNVLGDFNAVMFERRVFGIPWDDLEPCDLPEGNEPVGATLTQDQVYEHLDALRATVRPDLWSLDGNGKAVRKN